MKLLTGLLFYTFCFITVPLFATEVAVKIDADAEEASNFLSQLNENGKEYGLTFTMANDNYQYRIALDAEGMTASDRIFGGGADAAAAVLDTNCHLLFIVSRGGRSTKGGAMNALSKEIDKKLANHLGISKK
ncbi:MAG TPA: hypothetical protein VLH08_07845 [Acidobacteriota bacterium]|nr:hypothetical protein [Acidobacteriota bacterium]